MGPEVLLMPSYPLIQKPILGHHLERINRFACRVQIGAEQKKVYLPNSGRLEDLLIPGARVMLEKRREGGKTQHDLLLIESSRFPDRQPIWVGMDSRLPTRLLAWSIQNGLISTFGRPEEITQEPPIGGGRLDLKITSGRERHWIETKSVNMLDLDGTARFPDAPTSRGAKHLSALIDLTGRGANSWIVFTVMREDARAFSPFSERDATFSQGLADAQDSGVGILAFKFTAGPSMTFQGPLPVAIPARPFPGVWDPKPITPGAEGGDAVA
jgi:sugar fermentation stimulation protein A